MGCVYYILDYILETSNILIGIRFFDVNPFFSFFPTLYQSLGLMGNFSGNFWAGFLF